MTAAAAPLLRSPASWIALALVVGGLTVVVPRLASVPPDATVVSIAWIGALLQAVVLTGVGLLLLPRKRLSRFTVPAPALLGATFCTGAGILANAAAENAQLQVLLVAPFAEEMLKLLAVAVLLFAFRPRLRGPLDGLVMGFFVGTGFAVVENVLYVYQAPGPAEAWVSAISRTITSAGTHGIYAGIAGAGLAFLILSRGSRGRRWGVALAALGAALLLHLLWDGLSLWLPTFAYLAAALVLYAAGIVVFILARRMSAGYELRTGHRDG
jgi:RsiW-degrading membrane proteinase PrsW (M82 family)